jgi:Flp pilus assembly protein TadG
MRLLLQSKGGNTAVETALLLPALAALMFGFFSISQLLWARNSMVHAAQEAGRYALAHPDASPTQIGAVARRQLSGVDVATVGTTVSTDVANGTTFVTITLTAPFAFMRFLGLPEVTLTGQARVPLV